MHTKKHAVVTGVSSGIGKAILASLLQNGWRVTGLSRRPPSENYPAEFLFQSIDLNDTAALKRYLQGIAHVDAVIHAAGSMTAAGLGQLDEERSRQLWQLHVHVAEILANTLLPKLPRGGRIVLIGSRTSKGMAGRSQYTATKAALVAMARSWAAELAPKGITVNVIAPGATDTPMLKQPNRQSSAPKLPPIGRYIMPSEVADYVDYLLSPSAAAITGQELMICGGASL
ncbi:SDR family NAD(P)-dependent oxidoreductase [Testudinibacter sp. P80/BLE/0925]|uniref:SDR family NAD(P)-dependent oxidoreductase n=1 Tax=Testudinibacter sp. TW-1 TaxID=3417757 RepID=UPI003D36884D